MSGRVFGIEKFKGLLVAGSFAMIIEFLMGLSDSIVAGNLLGEQALAGINLISPVMTCVTFFAGMIGVGMGINYAYESGRCDSRRARQFFTQGLWSALGIGSVMVVLLSLLRGAFMSFMSPSPEIIDSAVGYWRWYVPSAFLEPLVILLVNAAMADGDSKLCFTSYAVQLTANLSVSVILAKTIGISGCAIGTMVANICALGVLSCHFMRKSNTFGIERHFCLGDTFRIMKSSFGDSSSFLCSASLFFFLNKYVISSYGSDMLPVLSVVIATIGVLEVFNGVGAALAPIVTVYAGEGNSRAIRMMMRVADRYAVIEGVALSAFLLAFPRLVVRMVGIDDGGMVDAAASAVRFVSLGLVFYSIVYLYNSYYIFISHETLSLMVTVLNGLVAPVALVMTFGRFGPNAAWASLAMAPVLAMTLFSIFLIVRFGRRTFPLLLSRERDDRIFMFDLELGEKSISETALRVSDTLRANGADSSKVMRASLMTEEVLMTVMDRNRGKRVLAEVTLDLNDGILLTLRDDGVIFDVTDADQSISSLRSFLVASVMERQKSRKNLITTGFNRNVFRF